MQKVWVTRRQFSVHLWVALVIPLLSCELYAEGKAIEKNAMQISLERSGGFTGIPLTVTLDTETLAPDRATQLRHLVEAADFFHLPSTLSTSAQPDRFEYAVTVREGDRSHTITVSEAAIPAPLRPLLDWLMATARSH